MDDSTEGIYLGRSHKEVVRQPQHPSRDCLFVFLSISIPFSLFFYIRIYILSGCVCASLDFSCCLIWNSCRRRRRRRCDRRIGKGKRERRRRFSSLLPYLGCQKEAGNDGRHSYRLFSNPIESDAPAGRRPRKLSRNGLASQRFLPTLRPFPYSFRRVAFKWRRKNLLQIVSYFISRVIIGSSFRTCRVLSRKSQKGNHPNSFETSGVCAISTEIVSIIEMTIKRSSGISSSTSAYFSFLPWKYFVYFFYFRHPRNRTAYSNHLVECNFRPLIRFFFIFLIM